VYDISSDKDVIYFLHASTPERLHWHVSRGCVIVSLLGKLSR